MNVRKANSFFSSDSEVYSPIKQINSGRQINSGSKKMRSVLKDGNLYEEYKQNSSLDLSHPFHLGSDDLNKSSCIVTGSNGSERELSVKNSNNPYTSSPK